MVQAGLETTVILLPQLPGAGVTGFSTVPATFPLEVFSTRAWWCTPGTPTTRKLRPEDPKSEASLGSLGSPSLAQRSRPGAPTCVQEPCLQSPGFVFFLRKWRFGGVSVVTQWGPVL